MNWVIAAHNKLALPNETLYKTINIIDRFLAAKTITDKDSQCVGLSAMYIASKCQDTYYHDPYTFCCYFSGGPVDIQDVINMEMVYMVHFYTELGMTCYHIIKSFCPAMMVAAAVYAARATLKEKRVWHKTLEMYSGFKEKQLRKMCKDYDGEAFGSQG